MRFTVFVLLFLEMRIKTFLRLDDEVFSSSNSESLQQSVYSLNRLQITNYGDYYMRDNKNSGRSRTPASSASGCCVSPKSRNEK